MSSALRHVNSQTWTISVRVCVCVCVCVSVFVTLFSTNSNDSLFSFTTLRLKVIFIAGGLP